VGVNWWFQRVPLLQHLQRQVVTQTVSFDEELDEFPDDESDYDFKPRVQKLATSIGYILNRAFGLSNEDAESNNHPDSDLASDLGEEYERLRVPVKDHLGRTLRPYLDKTAERWDTFATIVGFTTLHPMPIFLQNMALFHLLLPEIQTPVPQLDNAQKELMQFILDIMYTSFHEGKGVFFKNYFRNPDDYWGEKVMSLGIPASEGIIPMGMVEELFERRNAEVDDD